VATGTLYCVVCEEKVTSTRSVGGHNNRSIHKLRMNVDAKFVRI